MRQVLLNNNALVVQHVAQPLLDDYCVLVQVYYSCISSGTERATITAAQQSFVTDIVAKSKKVIAAFQEHGLAGTRALINHKLQGAVQTLGYSCSGQVLAVGKNIQKLRVGDWVACAGAEFAFHADYIVVPEHLVARISDKKNLRAASITTIGAIALQGIRRAHLQLGERVAIIGMGILGQVTAQLAQIAGCTTIAIDIADERLEIAYKLGARATFNPTRDNIINEINALTDYHGVDHTIITAASSSHDIMQQAMQITRKKGNVVIVGDVGLHIERQPFYQKEIDLFMSCSYGPGRYDTDYELYGRDYPYPYVRWTEQRNMASFVELIEHNKIDLTSLITQEVPIAQATDAFQLLADKKSLCIVVSYQEQEPSPISPTFKPAAKISPAKMRVGIIGAGGFAKIKLLPLIKQQKNIVFTAVADPQITNALSTAQVYGIEHTAADYRDMLAHDHCDIVIIASPHAYHAQQITDALTANKAVFVEKPLITTQEQLQSIKHFLHTDSTARLCVDFNRSYAPMIKKIKEVINKRSSPLVITYRMNAGYIPHHHWTQTELGGGRIIGEACHIIDLFHDLTGAQAQAISVETIGTNRSSSRCSDNATISISFSDGSVATLLYTSLGHSQAGKERMELFFDGKTIILDDYQQLSGYGLPKDFSCTTKNPDKGHTALLNEFFVQLQTPTFTPPIAYQRLYDVADITLHINNLVNAGGGAWEPSHD